MGAPPGAGRANLTRELVEGQRFLRFDALARFERPLTREE